MHKLWAITAAGFLAISAVCRSPDSGVIFSGSIFGDAKEAKSHLDAYKQIFLVCIYEDHWEDRGPHEYSLHHFKGTVVRTYKGNWMVSEKIAFVHGVDAPALTTSNAHVGSLIFVFTDEHKEGEIGLDAGDFLGYDTQLERQIRFLFPKQEKG